MARSTWLHILIAVAGALAVLLFVRLHQCERRPAAFRQRLGRASSRRGLVQGLSRDRGRDRGREGSRAGFRRDRQPGIDHGAVAESVHEDQPSPDAQSHHHARVRPMISRIIS